MGLQHGNGWEAASLGYAVDALIALEEVGEALQYADRAVQELRSRGDEKEAARAMHHLVHAYVASQLFDKAWQVAQEAVEISCQDLSESHSRVVAYLTCMQIYLRTDNFVKAAQIAEKAEEILETLGISYETSSLRHLLKEMSTEISRRSLSEAKADDSAEVKAVDSTTDEEPDESNERRTFDHDEVSDSARAHSFLDSCRDDISSGRLQEALKAADVAADLFADLEDGEGEARALLALAAAHTALQQYKQALSCAKTSLEISRELDHFSGQADALHMLACAHNYLQRPHEALPFAQSALSLYKDTLRDARNAVKMCFVIVD